MTEYKHTCRNSLVTIDDFWAYMLCIACHDEYKLKE